MTTIKELIGHLQNSYKPEDVVAVAIWTRDDVLERAKERGLTISLEEADQIIDRIDRRQDATLGITWDTIDAYLDDREE
jgi:hypothetical protein